VIERETQIEKEEDIKMLQAESQAKPDEPPAPAPDHPPPSSKPSDSSLAMEGEGKLVAINRLASVKRYEVSSMIVKTKESTNLVQNAEDKPSGEEILTVMSIRVTCMSEDQPLVSVPPRWRKHVAEESKEMKIMGKPTQWPPQKPPKSQNAENRTFDPGGLIFSAICFLHLEDKVKF